MRHILVTGAGRGIGLEFVRQLLARGDRVIATARKPAQSTVLNKLAFAHPGHLHVLPLDVEKSASIGPVTWKSARSRTSTAATVTALRRRCCAANGPENARAKRASARSAIARLL